MNYDIYDDITNNNMTFIVKINCLIFFDSFDNILVLIIYNAVLSEF